MPVFDISERIACRLVGLSYSAFRRPLKADTPDDLDGALRAWSVDFQFDSTIAGKPVKTISIVEERTRECLGGIADYFSTGLDFAEQLDVLALERGMPKALRMDKGPELIGKAVAEWAS